MRQDLWKERIARVEQAVGEIRVVQRPKLRSDTKLIAVTSSRLGKDSRRHRRICQFLTRTMQDCRQRSATLLVASGSAVEPWAIRAAELFGVPVIRVSVESDETTTDPSTLVIAGVQNSSLSRDAVVIALADRIDAIYVRQKGAIAKCIEHRLTPFDAASTRVAISLTSQCAGSDLVSKGAIGWFLAEPNRIARLDRSAFDSEIATSIEDDDAWTRSDGSWLVHCTRKREGAWPGETQRQYRDSILLGEQESADRGPLQALTRIVRSRRLVAGSIATSHDHPVVCFSAVPLQELMQRRCFRPQLGRWDYEPYGVAVRMSAAKRLGMAPVIYGDPKERGALSPDQRYRFHPIGKTYDWREEREWRANQSVNLKELDSDDVRIFALDSQESRTRLVNCPWRVTLLSEQPQASVTNRKKPV